MQWAAHGVQVLRDPLVQESGYHPIHSNVRQRLLVRFRRKEIPAGHESGAVPRIETGEEYLVFSGHTSIVWEAEWSPDGTRIASGDEDGILRVWDVETGEEVYRFAFPGLVVGVDWSPDGKYLIVPGIFPVPGMRRVWQSTAELVDYARQCCVLRELTPKEREQFGLSLQRE